MNKKYINPKTGKKYRYYSPDGKGYENVLDWALAFEPSKYPSLEEYMKVKIVKQQTTNLFNLFWVSTVWLGLDHSWGEDQEPLIFETMVFCRFPFLKGEYGNGCSDLDINRYTTRRQAQFGHKKLVKEWSKPIKILEHLKNHFTSYKYRRKSLKEMLDDIKKSRKKENAKV